jgi:glycerol kinase
MGAAYLAGLSVGYWKNREEVEENWAVDKIFSPVISEEERQQKVKGWNKAVRCSYLWAKED